MKRILIIEDNLVIRENLIEILELANYEVIVAQGGKMGMALSIMHQPDLVLCDILMPEVNGYEVLNFLRANEELRHIPLIFLTAFSNPNQLIKGIELGACDYISKPFTDDELIEAIELHLN
jgi:CRP/FNR family cyclic AMP-dependent transcriptional regulator